MLRNEDVVQYPALIERNTRNAAQDVSKLRETVQSLIGRVDTLEAEQRFLLDKFAEYQSNQSRQKEHDDLQAIRNRRKEHVWGIVLVVLTWVLSKYL